MSYEHCVRQNLYEPKPGVPLVELESWVQPLLPLDPVSLLASTLALSVR